jgi:hypothetical protein
MIPKKSFEIKTIHKFRDGRLHVCKVSTSRNWMCRFYADGQYKVKSTLETNVSTAKQIAMDWYDEFRFNQKQGIPIHEILFSEASEKFKTYQRNLDGYFFCLSGECSTSSSALIREFTDI